LSLDLVSGRSSAWLERLVRDQEVAGSNPVAPTQLDKKPFGQHVEGLSPFRAKSYVVQPRVQSGKTVPDTFMPMNVIRSVIATNAVVTLADGTREVIADSALEDSAAQINEGGGFPLLIEHDWLRPCGWVVRAWTEREGNNLKLVTEADAPETDDEWVQIRRKYSIHLSAILDRRAGPFKDSVRKLGKSGASMSFDIDSVLVESANIAREVCPSAFAEVDSDGLVPLNPEWVDRDGLLTIGEYFLVPSLYFRPSFGLPNAPNREVIHSLMHLAKLGHNEVRLALDPDRIGIRESFELSHQRDYWWGPHYVGKPSEQPYGMTIHGPTRYDKLNKLIRTEFWWYGKSRLTMEIEELHDRTYGSASEISTRGMRFVHSIFDEQHRPCHLDGAIRLYSELLWAERTAEKLSDFGKKAKRVKLWRVDRELASDAWYEVIHNFFRGNYTIGEYFRLPSPDEYRSHFEQSKTARAVRR
jgi:hypothetical protein